MVLLFVVMRHSRCERIVPIFDSVNSSICGHNLAPYQSLTQGVGLEQEANSNPNKNFPQINMKLSLPFIFYSNVFVLAVRQRGWKDSATLSVSGWFGKKIVHCGTEQMLLQIKQKYSISPVTKMP